MGQEAKSQEANRVSYQKASLESTQRQGFLANNSQRSAKIPRIRMETKIGKDCQGPFGNLGGETHTLPTRKASQLLLEKEEVTKTQKNNHQSGSFFHCLQLILLLSIVCLLLADSKMFAKRENRQIDTQEFSKKIESLGADLRKFADSLSADLKALDQKLEKLFPGSKPQIQPVLDDLANIKSIYLKPQTEQYPSSTINSIRDLFFMNFQVEDVTSFQGSLQVGGSETRLAVKDASSYLIATMYKGYTLVENGEKKAETRFPAGVDFLEGICYARNVDAYFMVLHRKLYNLGTKTTQLELWIDQTIGWSHHTPLEYSDKVKRILTSVGADKIAVIDPRYKAIEFEYDLGKDHNIVGYKFIGRNHEYIVFLTWYRHIGLMKYDPNTKKGSIITKLQFTEHSSVSGETALYFEMDSTQKVILVSTTYQDGTWFHSRMIAFELWNNKFILKDFVSDPKLKRIEAIRFVRYHKNFAIFVAVDQADGGTTHLFKYDIETGKLTEDTRKRVPVGEHLAKDLLRVEDWFYYTGKKGNLRKLRLETSSE